MNHTVENALSDELRGAIVVADTSSLLMEGDALLHHLPECQLVIPSIVIRELENTRTSQSTGIFAREWLRLLESLRVSHGSALSEGITLPDNEHIKIRIEQNHVNQGCLPVNMQDGSNDSTILSVTKNLANDPKWKEHKVVLLSNDVPMRLNATVELGLDAYEFNASVISKVTPFSGAVRLDLSSDELEDMNGTKNDEFLDWVTEKAQNKAESASVLARVHVDGSEEPVYIGLVINGEVDEVQMKQRTSGIVTKTVEQSVALDYLRVDPDELPVVSLHGKAGTGKTLLTLAAGLEQVERGAYDKLMVFRSLHEMGMGQEMGYLPGGVEDKMGPWAGAVKDAIDVIAMAKAPAKKNEGPQAATKRDALKERLAKMIEVSPITYLRGRSLPNAFIVLEEAQNFSRSEILNILSRVGNGSKIVLTFDAHQVDNRYLQSGNRADVWSVIHDLKTRGVLGHITLQKTERSVLAEIASEILNGN